jgi:hypothetical protein
MSNFFYLKFIFILSSYSRMSYYKKQKKHTRTIILNTDDAFYVNPERKEFRFRFAPINIEDESKMYVKSTTANFKTTGLAVKSIQTGLFLGSSATYSTTYSVNPAITFETQDGKGSGATGIGLLAPSGASGSASSATLTVNPINVGAGYTGTVPTIAANIPTTGGSGATLTPDAINTTTGAFGAGAATLVAGSGYNEAPTFTIPAPQASLGATFGAVPYTAATGVITGVPTVSNPTVNGFYNTSTFAVGFVSNPITAYGIYQTNATGGFTNIVIENSADNGYYGTDHPLVLPMTGGTGFTYTPTYSGGRCVSIIITAAGSGYGNNLVDYPFTANAPATPVAGSITNKTITAGRLTALTFGTGGSKYYKPTVNISAGLQTPVQATYQPVFKIPSVIAGARMLTHGQGYTRPPKAVIDSTYRVSNGGDLPLIAEIAPTYLVEKNNYYIIKADGFEFNRSLYTNTDNKGFPTIAICSTNEQVNDENYTELILPSQVIDNMTITILDKDGLGLETERNMIILLTIEELDDEHTDFEQSKRRLY